MYLQLQFYIISEYHALSHVRYPRLGVGVELTLAMQQKIDTQWH